MSSFVEDYPAPLFDQFVVHLKRCATAYHAELQREQRKATLSNIFYMCDNSGVRAVLLCICWLRYCCHYYCYFYLTCHGLNWCDLILYRTLTKSLGHHHFNKLVCLIQNFQHFAQAVGHSEYGGLLHNPKLRQLLRSYPYLSVIITIVVFIIIIIILKILSR